MWWLVFLISVLAKMGGRTTGVGVQAGNRLCGEERLAVVAYRMKCLLRIQRGILGCAFPIEGF